MSSYISSQVSRLGKRLKNSTQSQISDYKERFKVVKETYDEFLKDLIVQGFDLNQAFKFAGKFFGSDEIKFAAIDGTAYSREIFDLVIFFGGAYASLGEIRFLERSKPLIKYAEKIVEKGQGISSCVPLYINEVPEVDQTFFQEKEDELALGKSLLDEEIINNSQVASAIMHFAEYFLAYSLLKMDEKIRLILMDRTLSGDQASLISKTSKTENWEKKSSLIGYRIDGKTVTSRILEYGRYRIYNPNLNLPPPRGDYLKYRVLYMIEEEGPLKIDEILGKLNITDRKERIEKTLSSLESGGFVEKTGETYEIRDELKGAWDLIKKLVSEIGKKVFEENRLTLTKDGKEHWLTTLDLSFLTLFCFYALIEECWKRKVLLIGLTKDTSAKDFKRHFIPICQNNRIISSNIDQEKLGKIPNTDRMFLQSVSLLNSKKINPPWGLIEYDSSFKTLVPDDGGINYVRGAIRNKISPEKLFLKSYIQLVKAETDPKLRSNVLAVDRLVYEEDIRNETVFKFLNRYGGFDESIEVIIYKNKNVTNQIQNVILMILSQMSESNIPELFGHNKPLFIADKIAKWHVEIIKNVIEAMRKWVLNHPELRDFIFYMTTFRERRREIEKYRGG